MLCMHTSINIKRHSSRWLLNGHSNRLWNFYCPVGIKCYGDDDDDDGNEDDGDVESRAWKKGKKEEVGTKLHALYFCLQTI
ncbi:unnamed protein product [Onchocerca flexuosa]|uniref:Ovule protein n=1 Tax=Onchocerca flexuosa TaxID=387005 RepID=A0A183H791_9BILA|nr:unnamed protein product [Onchocerca flexuosa]